MHKTCIKNAYIHIIYNDNITCLHKNIQKMAQIRDFRRNFNILENCSFYTNKIAQQNIDNSFILTSRNLLTAIHCNCFTDKRSSTVSVLINVVRKALIRNIHLTETCEDFVCAGVEVVGDTLL